MGAEPFALAGVCGEHLGFEFHLICDVHEGRGLDGISEGINSFDRVTIIKVWDTRSGNERERRDVGRSVEKADGAADVAGHFVVHHVIARRMGEDEAGRDAAKEVVGLFERRRVVTDFTVFGIERVPGAADD